jgi:hypothetical protein
MELPLSQDLVDKVHSDAAKVLTQRTNGAATIHVTTPSQSHGNGCRTKTHLLNPLVNSDSPWPDPNIQSAAPVTYVHGKHAAHLLKNIWNSSLGPDPRHITITSGEELQFS